MTNSTFSDKLHLPPVFSISVNCAIIWLPEVKCTLTLIPDPKLFFVFPYVIHHLLDTTLLHLLPSHLHQYRLNTKSSLHLPLSNQCTHLIPVSASSPSFHPNSVSLFSGLKKDAASSDPHPPLQPQFFTLLLYSMLEI